MEMIQRAIMRQEKPNNDFIFHKKNPYWDVLSLKDKKDYLDYIYNHNLDNSGVCVEPFMLYHISRRAK